MKALRLRRSALVISGTLALAACGSTVQQAGGPLAGAPLSGVQQGLAAPGTATDALGVPVEPGTPGAVVDPETGQLVAGPTSSGGSSGFAGGSSGSATAPGTAARPGSAAAPSGGSAPQAGGGPVGPGVTDKTVKVGVVVSDNADAANEAAGVQGVTVGDTETQYKLLAADINGRGGIAGRKVELVFHKVDGASNETADSQAESICAAFTQDNAVYAVILGGGNDNLRTCIRKNGAVQVNNNLSGSDDEALRSAPSYASPSGLSLTRIAKRQPAILKQLGYFTPGAKYGLVTFDGNNYTRAAKDHFIPAMQAQGVKFDEVAYIALPQRTSDLGAQSAAINSAVLRFRQNGITHVQFLDVSASIALFFMPAAESQGYRPKYGLNTQDGGQALIGGGTVPAGQGIGAVGYGWLPALDVTLSEARQNYSPEAKRCLKLFADGGVEAADGNAELVALLNCDAFSFLERAVAANGPNLSQTRFEVGIQAVGSTFRPAGTFTTKFGPRTDGVASARPFAFFEDCTCFKFTGPQIPL